MAMLTVRDRDDSTQGRPTLLEATDRFRRDTGGVELELPSREDAVEIPAL